MWSMVFYPAVKRGLAKVLQYDIRQTTFDMDVQLQHGLQTLFIYFCVLSVIFPYLKSFNLFSFDFNVKI